MTRFFDRELRVVGEVARAQHAATRAQLDPVGTRVEHLANLVAHPVDAVDDAVRDVDVHGDPHARAARHEVVAVAARLAQQADRQLHAGRREVPGLGGETDADRRVSGVAHGGHAGCERHS
jgi:hypothetical protein